MFRHQEKIAARLAVAGSFSFVASGHSTDSNARHVRQATLSGTATLPGGNRLKLTAVALMLPGDVEWGGKNYARARPRWVDPRTGKPLSGPEHESRQKEQSVPRKHPRLFLRVEKQVLKVPPSQLIRIWHNPFHAYMDERILEVVGKLLEAHSRVPRNSDG